MLLLQSNVTHNDSTNTKEQKEAQLLYNKLIPAAVT